MSERVQDQPEAASRLRRHHLRFERFGRLVGAGGLERLARARVTLVGLGGVGSWAAESLARAGVGRLTLVDFDVVCLTNFNRQLHAVEGSIGKSKAALMAERVRAINPGIEVEARPLFYTAENSTGFFSPPPDIILDAIDNVTTKTHLLVTAVRQGVPVITSLGSAARFDPTRVRVLPLVKAYHDPLGTAVRRAMKTKHDMTTAEMRQVRAVYSNEPLTYPIESGAILACGVDCICPGGDDKPHSCSHRSIIHGSAVFVTAAFGLAMAAEAVRLLLGRPESVETAAPPPG